jgi:hypothetical protein
MEIETCENTSRYNNSELYAKLLEISPEKFDRYLERVASSAEEFDEEELLENVDVLIGFVCRNELPSMNEKILDVTIDGLLPALNRKDSEKVRELVSTDYRVVLNNLEEIQARSDSETASRCLFAQSILRFPGTKLVDPETGLEI